MPVRNCGWLSTDNQLAGSDAGKQGGAQSGLGDEWTNDEMNRGVKACQLAAPNWTAKIAVTRNFELDDCVQMGVNAVLASQLTLGCYWLGRPGKDHTAVAQSSWGTAGNFKTNSFPVPVPNCGW